MASRNVLYQGGSTSRAGHSAPSPSSAEVTELSDSLGLQKAILESLQEMPPTDDTARQIAATKEELARIQKKIQKAGGHREETTSRASGKMNWSSPDFNGGMPSNSSSGNQTPVSLGSASSASGSGIPYRKRPHATYLDDGNGFRPSNKSRRTTPSPLQTGFSTPSLGDNYDPWGDDEYGDADVVDLTGDDTCVAKVVEETRRAEKRFQQTKADEDFARRLDQGTVGGHGGQVVPSPSPAAPNAFSRILNWPSQAAQSSQPPGPSTARGEMNRANMFHSPAPAEMNSVNMFNSPTRPVTQVPGPGTPSHGRSRPYPMAGEYPHNPPRNYYPRAFHRNSPDFSNLPGQAPEPATRAFGNPGPARPSVSSEFTRPAAYQAGQAALSRQDGRNSFTGLERYANGPVLPGSLLPFNPNLTAAPPANLMSPLDPANAPFRPGNLSSGSYGAQDSWSSDFSVGSSSPGLDSRGDSLQDIISSTNHYDWDNGVDQFGNALSERLRTFYDDLQDDPRKTDQEIKDLLANIRPDEDIPQEDRVGTPDGLRYPLYPHQQLALQWMINSEEGKNMGGILADDMGLGKTISMLALILSRPSSGRVKTNLIIGPVALIKQWESEVKKKIKSSHSLSVTSYHGKSMAYEDLRRYDVVLTSYGKLGSEFKRYNKWVADHPGADPAADRGLAKKYPLVHPNSTFYRVILDEAQCIKNAITLNARGACAVRSEYRWCLTGTPMMNGIHELQSLIKFLRIAPYKEQKAFNKAFGSLRDRRNANDYSRTKAMSALRILLKAIMLRRMKTSQIDGKPLVQLPPKTEEVDHAVFSNEEQQFYKLLESQTRIQFNKYLRAGTVGKNYSNILVLLLRLRQACCHPHLNLDVEYVNPEAAAQAAAEVMRPLAESLSPDVVKRLIEQAGDGFSCPICLDAVLDPTIVIPCGHNTCSECFSTLINVSAANNLQAGDENISLKCPECRGPINSKKIIDFTTFKKVHMAENAEVDDNDIETASEASETDSDDSTESGSDEDSGDDVDRNGNLKNFIVDDDDEETASEPENADENGEDDEDDEDEDVRPHKPSHSKHKSKKGKKNKSVKRRAKQEEVKPHQLKKLRLLAKKNKGDYRRYMKYLKKNWLPSAKVSQCCDLLKEISESGDKTIIFSQFTFLLDLLEIPIKYELGIKYCRYDGGMSRSQRDAATQEFQDPNSRAKVMLVSLKAGNAGLNLTAANHVIIMDPFWNPYVEMQAVDRAHRIGQQKPVQVHRLLVENTVEDRIIALQEKKRALVDAALDEGESKQLGRLSTQDLMFLFNASASGGD